MANKHGRAAAFNPHYERVLNVIRFGMEKDAISLFSTEQYCVNQEIEYVFEDRMLYKITPLNWAVRFNKPGLCKYLLDHGARPHSNLVYEYYPLHEACCRGFDKIVSIFIERRCDLNKTTPTDQDTPLHIACVRGNVGCVHLLLSANANPKLRNAAGYTPLEAAVYNNQDDLVKLFAAYGINSSPATTTNTHLNSSFPTCTTAHAPVQRRHSLCSPTLPVVQQLFASVRPQTRPNSVILDSSEDACSTRPPSRVRKPVPTSCVASLPSASDSHSYIRTTAPSLSQFTVTQGDSVLSDLLRPTYMSQLSIASPSTANSPSPVEKDGAPLKTWTTDSRVQIASPPQSVGFYHSVPSTLKFTAQDSRSMLVTTSAVSYNSKSCGQYPRLVDSLHTSKTSPGNEKAGVQYTTSGNLQSQLSGHRRPQRKHGGLQQTSHKEDCGRLTTTHYVPSGSPDSPLPAQPRINQDRMQSSGSVFQGKKTLSLPPASAPVESLTPSPSRERINLLSHFLCNALDALHSGMAEDAALNVVQKLSEDVAKVVNLSPEQLKSLVDLALSQPPSTNSPCPPDHVSTIPHLSTAPADHPAEALREIGLNVDDHPRDVRLGDPVEGYLSIVFKLRSNETNSYHKRTDSLTRKNEVVKVLVKVFNLRNPVESSLYHSLDSQQSFNTDTDLSHLTEVFVLQQLANFPHPNVAELMSHFKADVCNQYDRFARQAKPDSHDEIYVTRKVADFVVLSMPCQSLRRYFLELQTHSFGAISESTVLCVLSQVLAASAHLHRNKISHNAIHPDNIFVDSEDRNTIVISNFGAAISFNTTTEEVRKVWHKLKSDLDGSDGYCRVAPEVRDALQSPDFEESLALEDLPDLLQTSDSYAAAQMIYELVLGTGHKFISELGTTCYSYNHIPLLSGLSSLSNHLLKTLFAYDATNRLPPLEGAIACLVLLFGPHPTQVSSIKDCKEWLLAETVEFYLRPSLKDTSNSDYSDSLAKLLCMYLTLANANPHLVWNACRFFQEQPDN